jgi:hypothetical protein
VLTEASNKKNTKSTTTAVRRLMDTVLLLSPLFVHSGL